MFIILENRIIILENLNIIKLIPTHFELDIIIIDFIILYNLLTFKIRCYIINTDLIII